jgi:UDP-3-O-[3-hydroxymyristoyl] glucosamine N-acyltransferase
MKITIAQLIDLVGGKLLTGDLAAELTGFSSLYEAQPGDVTFFHDPRYAKVLEKTKATAVIVAADFSDFPEGHSISFVGVETPSSAFDLVVDAYGVRQKEFTPGVHPTAVIDPSATLKPEKVSIGANVFIGENTVIGDGATIEANCSVGYDVTLGEDCYLYANVTVREGSLLGDRVMIHSNTVIGSDGFGYEFENGRHRKVRQSGIVQIDADVEIGAGTTIDRARFGRTWIGEGTKIDNQVQIGHNVILGKHCIIVAACAIAGSAIIGDYVIMAAQTGVAGHVTVGAQSILAARCGVTKDLPAGQKYLGYPAIPLMTEQRRLANVNRLPKFLAKLKALEEEVARLKGE